MIFVPFVPLLDEQSSVCNEHFDNLIYICIVTYDLSILTDVMVVVADAQSVVSQPM